MRVLLALVAVTALVACSGSGSGKKAAPTTTTTAVETTVGAGAPKATTGGGTASSEATTTTRGPELALTSFRTPSGNIGCMLSSGGVRCDIGQSTYTPSPKPPACQLDWGGALEVTDQGPGHFICHGDTVTDPSAPALAYGARARQGSVVCVSEQAGITCTNEAGGHGFFISRDSYKIF